MTKWKWSLEFEGVNDSDAYDRFLWHVRVLQEGLKAIGHTDVSFNYEGNYFIGTSPYKVQVPPDAVVIE